MKYALQLVPAEILWELERLKMRRLNVLPDQCMFVGDGGSRLLVDIKREGTAILIVTHDAKIAARADRVLFMKDGNIVSELPLQKLSRKNMEARTEKVLAAMAAVGI